MHEDFNPVHVHVFLHTGTATLHCYCECTVPKKKGQTWSIRPTCINAKYYVSQIDVLILLSHFGNTA